MLPNYLRYLSIELCIKDFQLPLHINVIQTTNPNYVIYHNFIPFPLGIILQAMSACKFGTLYKVIFTLTTFLYLTMSTTNTAYATRSSHVSLAPISTSSSDQVQFRPQHEIDHQAPSSSMEPRHEAASKPSHDLVFRQLMKGRTKTSAPSRKGHSVPNFRRHLLRLQV